MACSANRGWVRSGAARRALRWGGVSVALSLCVSCGGKAYGDEEDEDAPTRPVGTDADMTRPNSVGGQPQPVGAASGTNVEPLPDEGTEAWADRLLEENCASCHAQASSVAGLVANGWLVPGDPEASRAIRVLIERSPPHDGLGWPSPAEIIRMCLYQGLSPDECRGLLGEFGSLLR